MTYIIKNRIHFFLPAHTTQFTEIGWHYLRHGTGVGKLDLGGSYVSILSPDKQDLTIVIETMVNFDLELIYVGKKILRSFFCRVKFCFFFCYSNMIIQNALDQILIGLRLRNKTLSLI